MNKTIMTVFALLIVSLATVTAVQVDDFCTDSDNGADIWTPGTVETEKGLQVDDCDGESENLKEGYCDASNDKFDNIKCSDYGAVCVTVGDKTVPDYCACPEGTHFDENEQACTEDVQVPEFGIVASGVALSGAVVGYALLRKRK